MHKCQNCGGPTVPEIDVRGKCPECVRLEKFMADVGAGGPGSDQMHTGDGNLRRYAAAQD